MTPDKFTVDNIRSVEFFLINGSVGMFPEFHLYKEIDERWKYGEAFGCDGMTLWVGTEYTPDEIESEYRPTKHQMEICRKLYDVLSDQFSM